MFDSRDTRMPRQPDQELADFIIDILRKEKDPMGTLSFADRIVSESNYTNRDFDDMVEAIFDAADVLMGAGDRIRNIGEAVYSASMVYCAWLANREKARLIDDLRDREYDDFMGMVTNYNRLLDAIDDRDSGRGRDDRDRGGRGGRGRDRDDRGRGRGRDDDRGRSHSRRDSQRSRSRHPDDIRAERQREAEDREYEERKARKSEPRSGRDEPVRNEPRRKSSGSDPVAKVQSMTIVQRKQAKAKIEMDIWRYLSSRKDDENRRMRREELESINVDVEFYLALGGQIVEGGQTHAEATKPREATSPAAPETAGSQRELDRGSRRAEAQRQAREQPQSVAEAPAFSEVFTEDDQVPMRARDFPKPPPVAEVRADEPRELTPPTIDPAIDYNANITSLGVQYKTGEDRPEWDPLVPTLQQWADAGYDVQDSAFIASLPPLPPIRGYLDHLPTMYDAHLWVPYVTATVDGYQMTAFRERDMNKDEIMIPAFGGNKRRANEPGQAPFYEAVSKTTRFDALAVKAEESASIMAYDEDKAAWEQSGKDPESEPAMVPVDTARHGQLAVVQQTIHAYNMDDALVRIQNHLASLNVGRDNMANIVADVQLHTLVGVTVSPEQYADTKGGLSVFEQGDVGQFLMLPHLWREFVEAKSTVPSVIWHKLDRHFTRIMNDILQNQLGTNVVIGSFAEHGGRLIDIIADKAGRYLAEKFTTHADYISRRLRCLSFNADENLSPIENAVWVIDNRRVVYADATMAELGITSTATQAPVHENDEPFIDHVEEGKAKRYAIRPEHHRLITAATDRLMGEARNTVSASSNQLTDMVVDIVTLDNYRCVLSQNWLSTGLYLSMQVSQF